MKNLRLLSVALLLAVSGCTSNAPTEGWTSLKPGTFDKLRDFVLENGTQNAAPPGCIRYDFPDDMNSLMLETENVSRITVWSRLSGDTVALDYLPLIMYYINPNDSWSTAILDDPKQEVAIRPIVDGMLAEIDN